MTTDQEISTTGNFSLEVEFEEIGRTNKWLLETLFKNDPNFNGKLNGSKVKSIYAKETGGAKGFMSRVSRVFIQFDNGNEYSVIVKIPTFDSMNEMLKNMEMSEKLKTKMADGWKNSHNNECETYELIKDVKNFPLPNVFYLEKLNDQNSGLIIMEDLCGKAKTIGVFRSATPQQCLNVARHYGGFQAQMNKNQSKWKGKFLDTIHINGVDNKEVLKFFKQIGETRPEFKEIVKPFLNFDFAQFCQYALKELPEELGATTFCHGDSWSNNFLMKSGEDGSVSDEIAAIIDWQTIFEGNPFHDISRLLTWSCDADIKRSCEKDCVNLQYNTFCEVFKKLGLEIKYTREEAHKLYEYAFIQQTIEMIGMTCFLKITNLENANEEVLDAQSEKMFLRCKLDLEDSLKCMEKYGILERFTLKK